MGLSPRFGLRSMMLAVAAVGVWIGLVAAWPIPAIYVTLLLIGPVAGAVHFGRDEPDRSVTGGLVGGVASHVAAGGIYISLVQMLTGGFAGWVLPLMVAASLVGAFVGLTVGVVVSVTLEVWRWMRRRDEEPA